MHSILIVDDEKEYGNLLCDLLNLKGYDTAYASTKKEAFSKIRKKIFDFALLDIDLGRDSGVDILKHLNKKSPETTVFMITGNNEIKTAIECMKNGATEYLLKPFNKEELLVALDRGLQEKKIRYEFQRYREDKTPAIIGKSSHTNSIKKLIFKAAQNSTATILITGETGTGKELVARHIHSEGPRHNEPFIAFNCASIPQTLIESELFGYEKGSFTGATKQRKGIFEQANGGVIFLDEIGEMAITAQSRLLRVLENKNIRRIGGIETSIDVQVICATNKNLPEMIIEKKFREDLFYRINVFNINYLPLRERKKDIIPIAEHFLETLSHKKQTLSKKNIQKLLNYSWPGNVREMRNIIERELIISEDNNLRFNTCFSMKSKADTIQEEKSTISFNLVHEKSFKEIEKEIIQATLDFYDNNISESARKLKMHRSSLRSKISKLGISTSAKF